MKLKKKLVTLSTCFLIRKLDPFFYELVIDSVKIATVNFIAKPKKFLNLRMSNKTLALFTLYLNIFSTIKLNTQKNRREVNLKSIRTNFPYAQIKHNLLESNEVKDRDLNSQFYKNLFFDIYLSRDHKSSTADVIKTIRIIENFSKI